MNEQMNLENYKKQVRECLKKMCNYTTQEIEELTTAQDSYWKQLLKDNLTPQETATGILRGLL